MLYSEACDASYTLFSETDAPDMLYPEAGMPATLFSKASAPAVSSPAANTETGFGTVKETAMVKPVNIEIRLFNCFLFFIFFFSYLV